jgi:hypothetical protein
MIALKNWKLDFSREAAGLEVWRNYNSSTAHILFRLRGKELQTRVSVMSLSIVDENPRWS